MTTLSKSQLTALLIQAGWPASDIPNALNVIGGQSGDNPDVVGWNYGGQTVAQTTGSLPNTQWSSYDTGLFQIDSVHNPDTGGNPAAYDPQWIHEMQNPMANAQEALQIFNAEGGWLPAWAGGTSSSGSSGGSTTSASTTSSSGGSSSDRSGFLYNLQSILNPSIKGGILGLILHAPSDAGNVAYAIVARSALVLFGSAVMLGGVYLLFATATGGVGGAVQTAGRVQELTLAPRRLALAERTEERRALGHA